MSQNSKFLNVVKHSLCDESNAGNIETMDDMVEYIFEDYFPSIAETARKTLSDIEINFTNVNQDRLPTRNDDLWIFGYGSLIWKADFPYVSRRTGFIRGFERMFYQNSTDHRGTVDNPGRVVTLITGSCSKKVYGMAYKIDKADQEEVLKQLDFRERNGYRRCSLPFYSDLNPCDISNGLKYKEIRVTMYIADQTNESYAGHITDINEIAHQIFNASGQSGSNREYVYKLSKVIQYLFPNVEDAHLYQLERILRNKEKVQLDIAVNIKESIRDILDILNQKYFETNILYVNHAKESISSIQQQFYD